MKCISSKENSIYKNALKLTRRKYRDAMGKYLIEGPKPLEDALKAGLKLDSIFVRETLRGEELYDKFEEAISLSPDLFDRLSDTQTSQGIIAIACKRIAEPEDLPTLLGAGDMSETETSDGEGSISEKSSKRERQSVLVLDRLQDPGNVGTIIRTAEAAGITAVLVMPETCDLYSPKVTRAAAGSLMRVPIIHIGDERQLVEVLHEAGLRLAVTALEEATDYRCTDLAGCGIVIGNEGRGVSENLLAMADVKVKIPMKGEIESLNAAVAAGILMYAAGKVK